MVSEALFDRLRRGGLGPERWSHVAVSLVCGNPEVAEAIGMALVMSGVTALAIVPPAGRLEALAPIGDRIGGRIGRSVSVRPFIISPREATLHVAIIDAGDRSCDGHVPRDDSPVVAFALRRDATGVKEIAFGNRLAVAEQRLGTPLRGCAEVAHLAVEVAVQVLQLGGGIEFDPSPKLASIPLAPAPGAGRKPPPRILLAGAGGAISHGVLFALRLDETTRAAIKGGCLVCCDHDVIEEHNLNRQWCFHASSVLGDPKAEGTAAWAREELGVETVVLNRRLEDAVAELKAIGPFDVAISSVDTWEARRTVASTCDTLRWTGVLGRTDTGQGTRGTVGIPYFSAGADLLSSFTRFIDARNQRCQSAFGGVERLGSRVDSSSENSCARAPLASSALPPLVAASWIVCQLRAMLCGGPQDDVALARGIEAHLPAPRASGLRISPGKHSNVKES